MLTYTDNGFIIVRTLRPNDGETARQTELRSWSEIVREILGEDTEVGHNPQGAPLLLNRPESEYRHISVSHTRDLVGVMFSRKPCGLDVESPGRDFGKVADHYLNNGEADTMGHRQRMAVTWCVKEAAYKLVGGLGGSPAAGITVEQVDMDGRSCSVTAFGRHLSKARWTHGYGNIICWIED